MADENPMAHGAIPDQPFNANEDLEDQALVLDRLLVHWPTQLQESDLRRELQLGDGDFDQRDRVDCAVAQLHWASQEDLGFQSEVHRTVIGKIERGEEIGRADTALKLCVGLGVSPNALFAGISWAAPVITRGHPLFSAHPDAIEPCDDRGRGDAIQASPRYAAPTSLGAGKPSGSARKTSG